ncbi:MAG: UDP-N-acetylglucosamine 1-carboxyvinyltransferase [Coriobacteriales bacterium]|jgi:UDP-N-acetylglucosamine 1-carboxyvinyltransferase|nr:UDP-N-acetylglucosamine 1-carboxyvinyltransferase [Coriobacteriales bacterium]
MQNEVIIVEGGHRVSGVLEVCGAKNSVLKLMAASIMARGICSIVNTPHISDVLIMADVLRHLGAEVKIAKNIITIDSSNLDSYEAPYELVAQMRASTAVLGPLIVRLGKARVAMPGGCQIGSRKLDMHIVGLQALGVNFEVSHGYINASVPVGGLKAARVALDFPSVGTTENLMVAACTARGTTVLENVAREPEIVDLANFLEAMGARISGQGSPVMRIEGRDASEFAPVLDYRTCGDRIEAGTLLVAGALGGGPLTVRGVDPAYLAIPLTKLQAAGCHITTQGGSAGTDGDRVVPGASPDVSPGAVPSTKPGASPGEITITAHGRFSPIDIQTLPYPGFPTDLQAQFMVLDAVAAGTSVITENIFENRFMFADELNRMGANIRIEGHHALIEGVSRLSGAPVQAPDLRAGAALVLAGLNAEGESVISGTEHIDRGYQDLVGQLSSVGARIKRTRR